FSCTLNNGIHFVTTPDVPLGRGCRINQEFELIEHSKLEFTLTLKVRRDPHIIAQFKTMVPLPANPPPIPPVMPQVSSSSSSKGSGRSGMRGFFSSPKKHKGKATPSPPAPSAPSASVQMKPQAPVCLTENLARYLKPDGTLARAFVAFKDVAHRCDTRLFETCYPLIGQRMELGNKFSNMQVGELVLQIFRLPPLPGIPPDQLPQSLDECHRGLRHINWHKVTYFEGTLTQNGGDCSSWRRRQLRVIGGNLVAFNDVTKRAIAKIDLKKALSVEDDQAPRSALCSPASGMSQATSRNADDYDGMHGVERSFRLVFPGNEEIIFFADTDAEKARWLEVLRALIGHIPPYPLWAELLWQRQEEINKRSLATAVSSQPARR
ncbi:PH-domain-containing protein, partial [Fistulina hepatica ATCC 64428]